MEYCNVNQELSPQDRDMARPVNITQAIRDIMEKRKAGGSEFLNFNDDIPKNSGAQGCPPNSVMRPIRVRADLGAELRGMGLKGVGVEIGTQTGGFTKELLDGWRQSELYIQVDVWSQQVNYVDDANVDNNIQKLLMHKACHIGAEQVKAGHAAAMMQCKNTSTWCAGLVPDDSLDFVYIDARHDRKGVLEDMVAYWPKLRLGGVFAGHDYTEQKEPTVEEGRNGDPQFLGVDWTLNSDGTRDLSGRVVKGAVDDFFSGVIPETPPDLKACPRQPVVTYREGKFNTWMVRK